MLRVVHYLNQFFAGIGGEDRSDTAPHLQDGAVGPGKLLQAALSPDAEVVGTVVCGDGRFTDGADAAAAAVVALVRRLAPDVLVAGPAFTAGRYGLACARVSRDVERRLGRPAITAMHPENPGVDLFRRDVIIVPTASSPLGMADAMRRLARLAVRRGRGEPLGPAAVEGYLPRGRRLNVRVERPASARATDLLLGRLRGEPVATEVAIPRYDQAVPPPPVPDLAKARLALVTECGLVPRGNPQRLEWVRASRWGVYDLPDGDRFPPGAFEVVHGGYDAAAGTADPTRLLPLDALRALVSGGELGALVPRYYATCGNHGILGQMAQHAREIAADLRAQHVDSVLLVAT